MPLFVAETDALVNPQFSEMQVLEEDSPKALLGDRGSRVITVAGAKFRGRRPLVMGSVLLGCALLAVAWRRGLCVPGPNATEGAQSMISLVQNDEEDLVHLPAGHLDTVTKWMADRESAADAEPGSTSLHKKALGAVQRALGSGDPQKSEQAVHIATVRASSKWRDERRKLKAHLSSKQNQVGNSTAERLRGMIPRVSVPVFGKTPSQKASIASCVFDVTQATTQLAAIAAHINDAVKTCKNVKYVDGKKPDHWASQVCALNVQSIFFSAASVAATLSVAANNCEASFSPNLKALCSGSIATLIQSVAQLGVSSELIATSCAPKPDDEVQPGPLYTPANIGSGPIPQRRLSQDNASSSAHARRLLFGGGMESDAAQCGIDVASATWYLAEAGLAINAAANNHAGGSCPPVGSPRSKAFCAVDVAGALYGLMQTAYFIFFAVVHCLDQLNTQALCGAGVDGIAAALAGVAQSGSAMWLTCRELRTVWPDPMIGQPALTKHMLKNNVLGNGGHGGRRLTDREEGVPRFMEQFSSPEEAFKHLGFDLTDTEAEFRKASPRSPAPRRIIELLEEEPVMAKSDGAGLFGGLAQCI